MILKKSYPVLAPLFSLAWLGLKNLPSELQEEAIGFIQRNALSGTNERGREALMPPCCPRCLKAHLIRIAKKTNRGNEEIAKIINAMNDKIGHNGYYLDGENVVKICQ